MPWGCTMWKPAFLCLALATAIVTPMEHPDRASLGGRVTDQAGAPVRGATVSATNTFTQDTVVARTDNEGLYGWKGLRQGRYSLFVSADGYGCLWMFDICLYRGEHTELNLTLRRSRDKQAGNCVSSQRSR